MKNITKLLTIMAVLMLPVGASAAYFQSGEQVSVNETMVDDVYVAGGMVTIAGPVDGDVFVAGASVNVTGDISADLFAVGSSVIITGNVADDMRVAGSSVVISGEVGDDLFAGGSLVQITSNVLGDAHIGGASVIIDGTVSGDLLLGSGSAIINGKVMGDVTAYSEQITFGSNAEIVGTLTYFAETEMDFEGVAIGGIIYNKYSPPGGDTNVDLKTPFATLFAVGAVIKLLGLLVVGLIIGLVWPKTAVLVTQRFTSKFALNLFVGLIALVAVPTIAILLFVTAVGWPVAVALMMFGGFVTIVSALYVGIVAGNLIIKWIKRSERVEVSWYSIVLGVLVTAVIALIPVVGWLAIGLLYMAVLGTILGLFYDLMRKLR